MDRGIMIVGWDSILPPTPLQRGTERGCWLIGTEGSNRRY